MSILRPEDWKRTRNAICALEEGSDRVEEWAYAVECGNWDAIAALTIWQLPNLQELTFEHWKVSNEFYPFIIGFLYRVRELQETQSPSASAMRNLQKIGVYGYNSERNPSPRPNTYLRSEMWMSLHQIFPFLQIPSVHTFSGSRVTAQLDHDGEIGRGWFGEPHKFSTKNLSLHLPWNPLVFNNF